MKILLGWFRLLTALAAMLVSPISMSFTVDTASTGMTGLWWNANEPGWGVSLTHQADVIFVTMYTYDASDNPTWYVASNCAVSGAGCTGALYKTAGGQMPTITWNGPVTADDVGTITLSFSDANSGTMNYTINGVHGSKVITRQVFRATTGGSTATGGSTVCLSSGFSLCEAIKGASILADDGKYLGTLASKYDSESVFNEYGTYGSQYSSDSIWNKYGTYGSEYSSDSPFNKYTASPPAIIKGGKVIGYLTANKYLPDAVHPYMAKSCDF